MKLLKKLTVTTFMLVLAIALVGCAKQKNAENNTIDYEDAAAFENALNSGENVVGKIVKFEVIEYHPHSSIGVNCWSGEHLNFISENEIQVKNGDYVVGRITKEPSKKSISWIIPYEVIEINAADKKDGAYAYAYPDSPWLSESDVSTEQIESESRTESQINTQEKVQPSNEIQTKLPTEAPKSSSYQSIYDKYSNRMKAKTQSLVDEYNREAANNQNGITGLAELCNNKTAVLAEICTDGIQEMAAIMMKNGDSYDTYSSWASKLQEVYQSEASNITNAYISSAS